jgi:uncharacterized protein YdeI (YjbR/CyaY-like superfamily)
MSILFFETQEHFRTWLKANHLSSTELAVGFYKVGSGKTSMTWSESVDQALCFDWIDGIRKSIDKESYSIRFTPRRKNSIWSTVNIKKVEELSKAGLMKPEGLAAFKLRKDSHSSIYSHETEAKQLSIDYEKQFAQNKAAWDHFQKQAPSYKRVIIHWIMSAKQEKTKISRLEKTIFASEKNERLDQR